MFKNIIPLHESLNREKDAGRIVKSDDKRRKRFLFSQNRENLINKTRTATARGNTLKERKR